MPINHVTFSDWPNTIGTASTVSPQPFGLITGGVSTDGKLQAVSVAHTAKLNAANAVKPQIVHGNTGGMVVPAVFMKQVCLSIYYLRLSNRYYSCCILLCLVFCSSCTHKL